MAGAPTSCAVGDGHRSIIMLSIFEKVLELIVKSQIDMFLENKIITEHQLGFRRQFSCEITVQIVINEWKLIVGERKMVKIIFVDLKFLKQ